MIILQQEKGFKVEEGLPFDFYKKYYSDVQAKRTD